ncbi:hypothetical protein JCM10207_004738 [Rhodosporidiobolus poonsookiae]
MKALPSLSAASSSTPTRPLTSPNPLVSSTTPPASEEPSPTDLLLATPPTLLKLFALCAPVIHAGATFAQLVTWTHPSFFGSLLVLLAWWGICLFGQPVAQYGLPAAILVLIGRKYLSSAKRGTASHPTPSSMRHRARPATLSPAAYAQLVGSANILASHVQVLRASIIHPLSLHFSFTPLRPSTPAPAYETAWFLVTSYPFYLVLTYLIPLRYLFLAAGSVALLWQAPFFTTLRTLLWRSACVRWACRMLLGVLSGGKGLRKEWGRTRSGLGIPGLLGTPSGAGNGEKVEEKTVKKPRSSSVPRPAPASTPAKQAVAATTSEGAAAVAEAVAEEEEEELAETGVTEEGEDVQVQFTVFENQRWWVGLDWTAALLPGERASWTDPANNPANPPASFVLPPPSVSYVPSPTKSDPNSRLKKTTEWRWLDPEWHVLRSAIPTVALPVTSPSAGPAGSPPSTPGDAPAASSDAPAAAPPAQPNPASPTISRIAAAAGVNLPPSLAAAAENHAPTQNPTFTSPSSLIAWDEASPLFAQWAVDDEGWQYGDNHFEKMGPRGGLGKYTRRRAWVRRAGLVERTERVSGEAAAAAAAAAAGAKADEAKAEVKERERESGRPEGRKETMKEKLERLASPDRARRSSRDASGPAGADLVRRTSSKGASASASTSGTTADALRRRKSLMAGEGGKPGE